MIFVRYQTKKKGSGNVTNREKLLKDLFSFSNGVHKRIVQAHQAHSSFAGRGKILYLLGKNDYVYQNQLAKLAQVQPGSLTQVLEKMEKDQLIIRERDKNDRRMIYVRLSKRGREQLEKNINYHQDFQRFVTEPLSDEEVDQFIATLDKLRGQFDKYIELHTKQKEMKKE